MNLPFKRRRTIDLATITPMKFYTVEKIGEKQSLTPEGFLLCEDVPIARTGTMIYGPNEVPLSAGPDGLVRVHREEDQVFAPLYMASFVGKSVVDEHPEDDVNPSNWKQLTIGVVLNPRRGTGMQSDLLIADFLITDAAGIEAVKSGKREVSCGYEADYEEIKAGEGRQLNMIANHVALVEAGRCGSRCAIGDRKTISTGESDMKFRDTAAKKPTKATKWFDTAMKALRDALKTKDEEKIEAAMKEAEEAKDAVEEENPGAAASNIHIHAGEGGEKRSVSDEDLQAHMEKNEAEHKEFRDSIAALTEQVNALKPAESAADSEAEKEMEGELAEEAPAGAKDRAMKARDSEFLQESFQDTVSAAEILVPGIRIPTFDRAIKPKDSLDMICKLRRTALDLAYATPDGRGMIEEINGKPLALTEMKCAAVRSLFRSTVAAKKAANNKGGRTDDTTHRGAGVKGPIKSAAELNELNKKFYGLQ